MSYGYSTVRVEDFSAAQSTPDLEAAFQSVCKVSLPLQPGRKGVLQTLADGSDALAIAETMVKLPNGKQEKFHEVLQRHQLSFSIKGDKRNFGRGNNPAVVVMWAPGATSLRKVRVRSLPNSIEKWAGLSDAELNTAIMEHFFI